MIIDACIIYDHLLHLFHPIFTRLSIIYSVLIWWIKSNWGIFISLILDIFYCPHLIPPQPPHPFSVPPFSYLKFNTNDYFLSPDELLGTFFAMLVRTNTLLFAKPVSPSLLPLPPCSREIFFFLSDYNNIIKWIWSF